MFTVTLLVYNVLSFNGAPLTLSRAQSALTDLFASILGAGAVK